MIDTKGIEPWRVLKALYDNSRPQGLEPITREQAEGLLAEGGDYAPGREKYFDYLHGRVMKVDLGNRDGFEEWLYDRDNGDGAAERAIAPLRESARVG